MSPRTMSPSAARACGKPLTLMTAAIATAASTFSLTCAPAVVLCGTLGRHAPDYSGACPLNIGTNVPLPRRIDRRQDQRYLPDKERDGPRGCNHDFDSSSSLHECLRGDSRGYPDAP